MTPAEARQVFEAAAEAWASMESTAAEREADYQLLRERPGADALDVTRAHLAWAVAHVGAAVLWTHRAAARDRLRKVEHLAGVG